MTIQKEQLHHHIRARMEQRGITVQEIETTINEGWNASDTKAGTTGKVFVFPFNAYWEQKYFEEKEVTVYYKEKDKVVLLTVKARYGKGFVRGGKEDEN